MKWSARLLAAAEVPLRRRAVFQSKRGDRYSTPWGAAKSAPPLWGPFFGKSTPFRLVPSWRPSSLTTLHVTSRPFHAENGLDKVLHKLRSEAPLLEAQPPPRSAQIRCPTCGSASCMQLCGLVHNDEEGMAVETRGGACDSHCDVKLRSCCVAHAGPGASSLEQALSRVLNWGDGLNTCCL